MSDEASLKGREKGRGEGRSDRGAWRAGKHSRLVVESSGIECTQQEKRGAGSRNLFLGAFPEGFVRDLAGKKSGNGGQHPLGPRPSPL